MDKTGGPAFPVTGGNLIPESNGMTLRDYFAAKAMAAYIVKFPDDVAMDELAEDAYRQADAMLAQREKEAQ